jgi:NSS family neurotransmitter:Na+ symporter
MTVSRTSFATRERFSSSFIFLLAAGFFIIGLHDFWHFPVYAAQHGGGAFVLVFAVTALAFGVPLLSAHLMIGRAARCTPEAAIAVLARDSGASRMWGIGGAVALIAGFMLLPVTSVVGGWMLAYLPRSIAGNLNGASLQTASAMFSNLAWDPERQLFWHGVFMWFLVLALGRPLHRGLELSIKLVAPVVAGLIIGELLFSYQRGEWSRTVTEVMTPDWQRLGIRGFWLAVGQAFYSLGLGTAGIMMYGAYLPARASAHAIAFWIIVMDIAASVAGAFIVLPVVYLSGGDLSAGPALVAQVAAVGYNAIPYGPIARTLLFILLFLVAWTAALGFAEPAVSWLQARRVPRLKAAIIVIGIAWLLGIGIALSFNYWRFSFVFGGLLKTMGAVDIAQIAVAGFLLPVAGLIVAVFAGWILPHDAIFMGGGRVSRAGYHLWRGVLRFLVPVWCIAVIVHMRLFL